MLLSYINIWKETKNELPIGTDVKLSLFISYDVNYQNTNSTDFTNLNQEIVDVFDQIVFMGAKNASRSLSNLASRDEFHYNTLKSVFGSGYAGKRNAILFSAIEHHMDYLLFLDDDEYPVAVTKKKNTCLWSGQRIFLTHLKEIPNADFTNGYHCGYVSPIPQIVFNEHLKEKTFETFINSISNDIVSWENTQNLMLTGGVTYASTEILSKEETLDVPLNNNSRFITGANLCVNLKRPLRTLPFYNPPGARGEDTFLSTLLEYRRVVKVPCYTFHDGFSNYQHILEGALPVRLEKVTADSSKIISRFVNTCIGWIRYKPLLVYITQPEEYIEQMQSISANLEACIPALADHFHDSRFFEIPKEFEKYKKNVKKHYIQFLKTQSTWKNIVRYLTNADYWFSSINK